MTVTTQAPADTTEARLRNLEKRLNDLAYKRTPAAPAADLAFRRADAADIWVATDPAGNVHVFLAYFGSMRVLVGGEIRGTWFVPDCDDFPPVSDPDFASLVNARS